MLWTRKLKTTLDLRDGRRLEKLGDAADLIISLPKYRQDKPHWQYVAELLLAAAKGDPCSVSEVTSQLSRALKADGMI
jgi:hypothetical protein